VNVTRFAQRVYVRNTASEFQRLREKKVQFPMQYTQGNTSKYVIFAYPETNLRHLL
jgi:hypothetical protein